MLDVLALSSSAALAASCISTSHAHLKVFMSAACIYMCSHLLSVNVDDVIELSSVIAHTHLQLILMHFHLSHALTRG